MTGGLPKSHQQAGAATKRRRSHERIMEALERLLPNTNRNISLVTISRAAGLAEGYLSKDDNKDLRTAVEERIAEYRTIHAFATRKTRRRIPVSLTAELALDQLDAEKKALKQQLDDARQTINMLVQLLEQASFDDKARVVPLRKGAS